MAIFLYFKQVLTWILVFGSVLSKDTRDATYMHLDKILRVLVPFHIVHQACTAAHPRLFLSPPSHTCHLPLQPNSSSLIQLISAARRMMTSAWWELFFFTPHSPRRCLLETIFFSSTLPSVQPPESLCPFVFWTLECDRVQILAREAAEGEYTAWQNKTINHYLPASVFLFLKCPEAKNKKTKSRPMGVADECQDIIKWNMGN